MAVPATVVMSEKDARKLTDRIRQGAENLRDLLVEAEAGGAWKALGYKSWTRYVEGEFDISHGQAGRLLTQARTIKEIAAVTGLPEAQVAQAVPARAAAELTPEDVADVAAKAAAQEELVEKARTLREGVQEKRQLHRDEATEEAELARARADQAPSGLPMEDEGVAGTDTYPDNPVRPEDGDLEDESQEPVNADKDKANHDALSARRQAVQNAKLPTEGDPVKITSAARVVQQILELPPAQVAQAYLKIPANERRVHLDVIPALLEAWAQAFADEVAPF